MENQDNALNINVNPLYESFLNSDKFLNINMKARGAGGSHFLHDLAILLPLMQIKENSKYGYKKKLRIALTRYSSESIKKSLWVGINDKIDRYGMRRFYVQRTNNNSYELDFGVKEKIEEGKWYEDTHVLFPHSFMSGSKSQDAKNKSIENVTHVLFEEADELKDEVEFEKFITTINRPKALKDDQNKPIKVNGTTVSIRPKMYMVCNPPPMNHFLVQKYFDLEEVDVSKYNVGTKFFKLVLKDKWKDSVNFTHGTWRDNVVWLKELKEIETSQIEQKIRGEIKEKVYLEGGRTEQEQELEIEKRIKKTIARRRDKIEEEAQKKVDQMMYETFEWYKDSKKESDREYYLNQILGLVPSQNTGLIYRDWAPIPNLEYDKIEYDDIYYGLDFGYSRDPCAFIEVKQKGRDVYLNELIYQTHLKDDSLFLKIQQMFQEDYYDLRIYADNQDIWIEPLKEAGLSGIRKASRSKGNGSIIPGIAIVKGYNIFYTESSEHIIKELDNYCWLPAKHENAQSQPGKNWNHAMDAIRYALIEHNIPNNKKTGIKNYFEFMTNFNQTI